MNQKAGSARFPLGYRNKPSPNQFLRPVRPWIQKSPSKKKLSGGPMAARVANSNQGISDRTAGSLNNRPGLLPNPGMAGSRIPESGTDKSGLNTQNMNRNYQELKNKMAKPVYQQWPRFKSIIAGNDKMPNSSTHNLAKRELQRGTHASNNTFQNAKMPEASDQYDIYKGGDQLMSGMSQNMSYNEAMSSSHFREEINRKQLERVNPRIENQGLNRKSEEIFKNPNHYNLNRDVAYPAPFRSMHDDQSAAIRGETESYESLRISPINRGNSGSIKLQHTQIEFSRPSEESFPSQRSRSNKQTGPTKTGGRKRPYSNVQPQDGKFSEQARGFETEDSYDASRKKPCLGYQETRFAMTKRDAVDPYHKSSVFQPQEAVPFNRTKSSSSVGAEPYSDYKMSSSAQESRNVADPYFQSDHKAPYDRKQSSGIGRTSPYSSYREVRYSDKSCNSAAPFCQSSVSEAEEDISYENSGLSNKRNYSGFQSEGRLSADKSNDMAEPFQQRLYYKNIGEIENDESCFEEERHFVESEAYSPSQCYFETEDVEKDEYPDDEDGSLNEGYDFDYRDIYPESLDDVDSNSREEEGCSFWVDSHPMSTQERACLESESRNESRAKQRYSNVSTATSNRTLLQTPKVAAIEIRDENRAKQGYPNFSTALSQRDLLTSKIDASEVREENRAKIGYPNFSSAPRQKALLKMSRGNANEVRDENQAKIGYPINTASRQRALPKKPRVDNVSTEKNSSQLNTKGKTSKIAIVKATYPQGQLHESEQNAILADILKRIDSMDSDNDLPKFNYSYLKFGALVFHCHDEKSADWLKEQYDYDTEVFRKCSLRVLNFVDLVRPVKVTFKTRNVYTKDHRLLFERLRLFNPEFMCHSWRVLDKVEEQNQMIWTFLVPLRESQTLRWAGLRGFTGIDQGVFEILDSPFKESPLLSKKKQPHG